MLESEVHGVEAVKTFSTRIDKSGRVVIPSEVRDRLNWSSGDELIVEERGGVITLSTYDKILAEAKAYFSSLVRPDVSLVDELLAERCAEFEREPAEEASRHE